MKIKLKGSPAAIKKVLGKDSASGPAKFAGKKPMQENPASRQAEQSNKSERSQITKEVTPTTTRPGTPEGNVVQGFDVVKKFARAFPPDGPEAARKSNNRSRDSRCNLGRSTWSVPVLD